MANVKLLSRAQNIHVSICISNTYWLVYVEPFRNPFRAPKPLFAAMIKGYQHEQ